MSAREQKLTAENEFARGRWTRKKRISRFGFVRNESGERGEALRRVGASVGLGGSEREKVSSLKKSSRAIEK